MARFRLLLSKIDQLEFNYTFDAYLPSFPLTGVPIRFSNVLFLLLFLYMLVGIVVLSLLV